MLGTARNREIGQLAYVHNFNGGLIFFLLRPRSGHKEDVFNVRLLVACTFIYLLDFTEIFSV